MAQTIACHQLLNSLSDYIDGTLSEDLCSELERHLATCENCQVVVNTTKKTIELYQNAERVDLPEGARARLFHCLNLEEYLVETPPAWREPDREENPPAQ
jgi:anti-sigma factor RsiW